jgi:enterobacterial common antigen flippase
MTTSSSHMQILKSSSIMGGSAAVTMLLGFIRTKFAAVLIGTIGIGLLANFTVLQSLAAAIANCGLQTSAVRDIATAVSTGDQDKIGRVVLSLRRMCWFTGLLGLLIMIGFASQLSQWTFGSRQHTVEIGFLGVVILCANLTGGQMALIQGMRRMGDLARVSVIGTCFGSIVSIVCYIYFGIHGIVPALVLIAIINLGVAYWFSLRVLVPHVEMTWKDSFETAGGMLRLGSVFMCTGLVVSIVSYLTNLLITYQISLTAVGIYSAAFGLSGMFVSFILNAMGADYYPRLAALAHDKEGMSRLVNEQLEVGVLLAAPSLLAAMTFAPLIIQLFYTKDFLPAVDLLQWFILGCLGRVLSWPLGFVMLALAKGRWFFVTELFANLVHLLFIIVGLYLFGLQGVSIAFFVLYVCYYCLVYYVARQLINFKLSSQNLKIFLKVIPVFLGMFIIIKGFSFWVSVFFGGVSTIIMGVQSSSILSSYIGKKYIFLKIRDNFQNIIFSRWRKVN